jgi:hypothetical protein
VSQEPSAFSISEYLVSPNDNDPIVDLSYLADLSDVNFRKFLSLDRFATKDQLYDQDYERYYKYVYSGCSETMGEYLSDAPKDSPFDYEKTKKLIWGQLVGEYLDTPDNLNLGMGGASILGITTGLVQHIRANGAPEHLLLLLPNPDTRITLVQDSHTLVSSNKFNRLISDIGGIGDLESKYSKKPHAAEDVLSRRWATYLNIQSLLTIEELCKALKINLVYSTWSTVLHRLLTAGNLLAQRGGDPIPFANYIVSDYQKSGGKGGCIHAADNMKKDCHYNDKNISVWDIGRGGDHMGAHAHIHMAELFIEELANRGL